METAGKNSGTHCHERHVGDEDERDREERGREGERDGEGEEGWDAAWRETGEDERERRRVAALTRMMCVCQSSRYRCPQWALMSLGSSLFEKIDFISPSEHSILL